MRSVDRRRAGKKRGNLIVEPQEKEWQKGDHPPERAELRIFSNPGKLEAKNGKREKKRGLPSLKKGSANAAHRMRDSRRVKWANQDRGVEAGI